MKYVLISCLSLSLMASAHAQAVLEPAAKTIKCAKAEVNYLAISPKGDRILVCTDQGAELMDLATGKRVWDFAFAEDKSTAVYHAIFNDNGEYVMLAGFTGKREVWDVKTGKKEGVLAPFKWLPNSLAMKELGLKSGNSPFDRYYQQSEVKHDKITAKADKNGSVVFVDAEGAALQTLTYPQNKDIHHRAPCLFTDTEFITGTDDGRVIFYTLR
jgi:WD40 repeat protein